MTLGELAKYVRSKNAGPFWMTIDIFCDTEEDYRMIKESPALSNEAVGALYRTDPKKIKRFEVDNLNVIKISMPRPYPQGARNERDMHSGQQYVQLLNIEL
ncbi:DUF4387 family protein [Clostridium sp. MCC353]|uniref:DUF4387 domain-containing protein n=1 Tax=Clostridium sp. MCC353 TaxID=2592646 RepID=UPI001C039C4F|nr:DUF4387 domain-containing protein [Clostridium sp. MCC353]MBT9778335.1 DUF4387 family protein [Clostridium sp. MCC353]